MRLPTYICILFFMAMLATNLSGQEQVLPDTIPHLTLSKEGYQLSQDQLNKQAKKSKLLSVGKDNILVYKNLKGDLFYQLSHGKTRSTYNLKLRKLLRGLEGSENLRFGTMVDSLGGDDPLLIIMWSFSNKTSRAGFPDKLSTTSYFNDHQGISIVNLRNNNLIVQGIARAHSYTMTESTPSNNVITSDDKDVTYIELNTLDNFLNIREVSDFTAAQQIFSQPFSPGVYTIQQGRFKRHLK